MDDMLEVRCFCNRHPLMAVAGRDSKTGHGFVHIKSWKGGRLYTEAVVTEGVVRIRCRECLRWHTVRIIKSDVTFKAERLPETIHV